MGEPVGKEVVGTAVVGSIDGAEVGTRAGVGEEVAGARVVGEVVMDVGASVGVSAVGASVSAVGASVGVSGVGAEVVGSTDEVGILVGELVCGNLVGARDGLCVGEAERASVERTVVESSTNNIYKSVSLVHFDSFCCCWCFFWGDCRWLNELFFALRFWVQSTRDDEAHCLAFGFSSPHTKRVRDETSETCTKS